MTDHNQLFDSTESGEMPEGEDRLLRVWGPTIRRWSKMGHTAAVITAGGATGSPDTLPGCGAPAGPETSPGPGAPASPDTLAGGGLSEP